MTPAQITKIMALVEKCFGAEEGWGRVRFYNEIEAALLAPQAEHDERAEFEAWCALDNTRYHPTDDNPLNRRDWKVWQAARASKGTK